VQPAASCALRRAARRSAGSSANCDLDAVIFWLEVVL